MAGNKRLRIKPIPPTVEQTAQPERPQKSAVPVSQLCESVSPDRILFSFKFVTAGEVLVPTLDVKTLGDSDPMVVVKAVRGPMTLEQRWAVKEGENKYQAFSVETGDVISVSSTVPLAEARVSFLFREA